MTLHSRLPRLWCYVLASLPLLTTSKVSVGGSQSTLLAPEARSKGSLLLRREADGSQEAPLFDCKGTGTAEAQAAAQTHWPLAKRDFCCQSSWATGCEVAAYDCTTDVVPTDIHHRRYCCEKQQKLCIQADLCMRVDALSASWMNSEKEADCSDENSGDKADCGVFPPSTYKSAKKYFVLDRGRCEDADPPAERIATKQTCSDAIGALGYRHQDEGQDQNLDSIVHIDLDTKPVGCLLYADQCTAVVNAEQSSTADAVEAECSANIVCICQKAPPPPIHVNATLPAAEEATPTPQVAPAVTQDLHAVAVDGCAILPDDDDYPFLAPRSMSKQQGTAAVRCCSQDGAVCESKLLGCQQGKSYWEAEATCEAKGLRLCSRVELEGGLCCGSGCSFDDFLVWTTTEAVRWQYEQTADGMCDVADKLVAQSTTAHDLQACQDTCDVTPDCKFVTFCPKEKVGCQAPEHQRENACKMYNKCEVVDEAGFTVYAKRPPSVELLDDNGDDGSNTD